MPPRTAEVASCRACAQGFASATGVTIASTAALPPHQDGSLDLPAALQRTGMEVVTFTERHALVATDAFATYGRGRHPASLNFGDCMTYAVARLAQVPLLFVGNDFALTDLEPALTT